MLTNWLSLIVNIFCEFYEYIRNEFSFTFYTRVNYSTNRLDLF
jgi:hypothetical protein